MGWGAGSTIFSEIITTVQEYVEEDHIRQAIYRDLIPVFEDRDADTLEECWGEDDAFDEAYAELYPEWADLQRTQDEDVDDWDAQDMSENF